MAGKHQQRRNTRQRTTGSAVVKLELKDRMGNPRWVTADVIDISDASIGVAVLTHLETGSEVLVRGNLGRDRANVTIPAVVKWCLAEANAFRAGLEFLDSNSKAKADGVPAFDEETDWYEVMQLSPNADADTISRVYRVLAQRYHPDNGESGSSELFVRLCAAHEILGNPEKRARYDAVYSTKRQLRWKIFDRNRALSASVQERRKRYGILGLLYTKLMRDPEKASMTIFEFEDFLGCPREHLQASLWYLRGKGLIQRSDHGHYTITVDGCDEVERNESACLRDPLQLSPASQD